MKTNDRVTYVKSRETQTIEPSRRNASGVVLEIGVQDGEPAARVEWEWAPGVGFWIFLDLLEQLPN